MIWHNRTQQLAADTNELAPRCHEKCALEEAGRRLRSARGFSLIEMIVVVAIITIISVLAIINLPPALAAMRLSSALNMTGETLSRARGSAYANRCVYRVDFIPPNNITITQQATGTVVSQVVMPPGISFDAEPGIPNLVTTVPDGFGTGANNLPIDFGLNLANSGNIPVYFYPDGSARDSNGAINNGVLYLAQPGNLSSSRAITVWGLTGRVKRWTLAVNSKTGVTSWGQL